MSKRRLVETLARDRKIKRPTDPSVNGVDMISSMPHEILHHILSFIPTQYAIRTSALSRAWRHVWRHTPCLGFYRKISARKINQTISSYRAPKIMSFHLRVPGYVRKPQIDRWIEFAVSRNVEKLTLVFHDSYNINIYGYADILKKKKKVMYLFPDFFYCSSSLETLHVNYDMIPGCTVSWKSLRKLKLWDCYLYDESMANILSGSPILETLRLSNCRGPQRLDLSKSHSLRRLEISRVKEPTEIVAPHLHYLSLESFRDGPCTLVDVSSLAEASIHIYVADYPPRKVAFLQTMLLKTLAKLQNVKRLTFTGAVLQIISLAELHGVPFPTFKVETLTVNTRFTRYAISGLAKLLQNSTELKKLILHAGRFVCIEDWDLDHYLESQGLNPDQCWRSKYEAFPTSLEFCSVISCKDATWKLMASFMEMVMRNVKTLETLVVGLKHIKPEGSDARWFEELLQKLQLLSNNNNVSVVLNR